MTACRGRRGRAARLGIAAPTRARGRARGQSCRLEEGRLRRGGETKSEWIVSSVNDSVALPTRLTAAHAPQTREHDATARGGVTGAELLQVSPASHKVIWQRRHTQGAASDEAGKWRRGRRRRKCRNGGCACVPVHPRPRLLRCMQGRSSWLAAAAPRDEVGYEGGRLGERARGSRRKETANEFPVPQPAGT